MNHHSYRLHDRLTCDNTALLLIDYQVGLLWDLNASGFTRNTLALARAARILKLPIIATASVPHYWGPTLPELAAAIPDAPIIDRSTVNPWVDLSVRAAVRKCARRKLILAGVSLDVAVTQAALAAATDGYDVSVALDASGSVFSDATATAVARLMHAGVVVANAGPLMLELLDDCADARACDVYAVFDLPFARLMAQPFGTERSSTAAPAFANSLLSGRTRLHTDR